MKVILLESIEAIGKVGDVVEVKDGYARNFLLPRKAALVYSKDALQIIEKKKKEEAARYAREIEAAKEVAVRVAALSCTVKVQAGEDDKLFGSVTTTDIHRALEAEGLDIDKKKIVIEEPIKKLGIYSIKVKLLPEVETTLKLWVVRS